MGVRSKFILVTTLIMLLTSCANTDEPSVNTDAPVEEEPYVVEKENTAEDHSSEEITEGETVIEENQEGFEVMESIELNDENITWLQESLKMAGYNIAVDGSFGANTRRALQSFKEKKGLSNDSVYSFEVKEYLEAARENYVEKEAATEVATQKENQIKTTNRIELTKENIYWLQESLKIAGHYTALDGSWGPNTKNALVQFKTRKELSDVETYDQVTKEILEEIREEKLIKDPSSDLVLLNKTNFLSSHYVPKNLVEADLPKSKYMELPEHVGLKANEMFDAAAAAGHNLYFASGYRSYNYQETLFRRRVSRDGFESAAKVVAIPGQSEHQTGLAIDITTSEMNYGLSQRFDQTEAFQWLMDHAYQYGFILRYRKGKEDLTGYIYEPWHYRYIGDVEMAKEIMTKGLVLEEYLTD